jgi:hypothetical protein
MTEQTDQPSQTPTEENNEHAEVYSVSQDQDGSLHFSRRDFLAFALAAGGTLLVKGVCPRFAVGSASSANQPLQAGMNPLPSVYLHAKPSIDSNILDTLHPDDLVLLIGDHADLGWAEVATQSDQRGWLERRFVDFTRAIRQASQDLDSTSTPTTTPTATPSPNDLLTLPGDQPVQQNKSFGYIQAQACGEGLQNGDFEAGHASWVEESSHGTNVLITDTWTDPHQGSWVANLGGVDYALDKLSQLFHVPADVEDLQTLEFYLKVTTEEIYGTPYDYLVLRLLDASGTPIHDDLSIADNTSPMDWSLQSIQLDGFSGHADRNIQIQFKATTDSSNISTFVIDEVSLNLTCGIPTVSYKIYLPIITMPEPTPTPTITPCVSYTCSCNSLPTSCTCNAYPCLDFPCACDSLPNVPCICNVFPCTCNAFPCSCNAYPSTCGCNAFPCACNSFPCFCNSFPTCSIT